MSTGVPGPPRQNLSRTSTNRYSRKGVQAFGMPERFRRGGISQQRGVPADVPNRSLRLSQPANETVLRLYTGVLLIVHLSDSKLRAERLADYPNRRSLSELGRWISYASNHVDRARSVCGPTKPHAIFGCGSSRSVFSGRSLVSQGNGRYVRVLSWKPDSSQGHLWRPRKANPPDLKPPDLKPPPIDL
jgi:hypothetical protein